MREITKLLLQHVINVFHSKPKKYFNIFPMCFLGMRPPFPVPFPMGMMMGGEEEWEEEGEEEENEDGAKKIQEYYNSHVTTLFKIF